MRKRILLKVIMVGDGRCALPSVVAHHIETFFEGLGKPLSYLSITPSTLTILQLLLNKIIHHRKDFKLVSTIGCDFLTRDVQVNDQLVTLQVQPTPSHI